MGKAARKKVEAEVKSFCLLHSEDDIFLLKERNTGDLKGSPKIADLPKKIDPTNINFKKYTKISECPEFKEFAKAHQWQSRRELKFAWRADPFDFIREFYRTWIDAAKSQDRTLMQSDILDVDEALWHRLQRAIREQGLPTDISLPAEKVARLEAASNEEKAQLEIVREWRNKKQREYRARIRKL